jgi:hypothetical protein
MRRVLWFLRSGIEAILGMLFLLVSPELILMEIRGHAALGVVLGGLLIAAMMLVLGFFLFTDAVRIGVRLKGLTPADRS